MKSLSVRQQLTSAFVGLVMVLVFISAWSISGMGALNRRFVDHLHGPAAREALALEVRGMANRRAIGVRDMVVVEPAEDIAAAKTMALDANRAIGELLARLRDAVAAPGVTDVEREQVARILEIEAKYSPVAGQIVELAGSGQREEAMDRMAYDCRPLLAALLGAITAYNDTLDAQSTASEEAAASAFAAQRAWTIALCVLAALGAGAIGWFITRHLTAALGTEPAVLGDVARRVAGGDLRPVDGAADAAPGSVLASMAVMQQQLQGLIGQVRASADSIATASAEIAHGNADLSSRTEEQAAALQQTSSAMDQLDVTVRQNADNARQANHLAQGASEVATRGGAEVAQVVATMKGIDESSRRIADITGVIDGIAFQTNILALNAAVEAARAGEQGRGFAVVAAEVRTLAGRSAEAAKEIKALIGASVARVSEGAALADRAGETMQDVVSAIRQVTDIVADISVASDEQNDGVAQVAHAVTQMDQATQQNAALVEESAAAAGSLKEQSARMVQAVAVFRTA